MQDYTHYYLQEMFTKPSCTRSQYYDAFISYGRADSKAFATKLYQDLTKQGFKVWFDQNDIPLAVDFQNQIDDGIERAHNFLFIIAPHSVNSPYCLKEIELAVKCNKRIIPLLHVEEISYKTWQERNPGKTEADWEEYKQKGLHSHFPNMHPEISRINWVYFRENVDNYDKSLADLIELFGRHEDYVSQHTQFLVKALEWERHQKQTRYLLTGKEREAAEKWLKVEFQKEQPPCIPANLHCEFICESIKNANNLLTQVFLSYAEANRESMAEIKQSLMRQGITVWTNLTDIQTGSEFIQAINRGIEGADTLVLLLSPSAVESEYCQQEVRHALSLNKRLITLLIEPTDDELLPESIRNLQYIDLTGELSEAEYQLGVDKLIKELRENKVYYQQHKVLLVKALKWQEQNRNRSILLRGYNLEHYQSWLEVARRKNIRPPTDLQVEFIAESAKQPPDLALDVFISYSRADADFARRLNDALQSQGKTTWFDQESIATGTDFQQEIHRGIEQSDNFLFVISPESVNSPYCADEVEYARGLNKRFVTLLHRWVNPAELHPELAKVQWLDFNRHGGDFLGNFSELVRALDTDREYVREHTKKSQMALSWTKGDKSVDLLLRGNECNRAYEWLQEVEQQRKQPELTEWLKEYIVASKDELERLQLLESDRQQRELWKQRRDKLVLSGFLVLMSGLSILSWWQTVEAKKQTAEAKKQTEIAQAYQLGAKFEKTMGSGFYQRGTLLAVESMKKSQKLNEQDASVAADGALRQGLNLLPGFVSGTNHDHLVEAVAFSSDGKYVATASWDNTARVWEPSTGKEVAQLKHDSLVEAVAFSADGKYVATASRDNTARVWDVGTGKEVFKLDHDGWLSDVAFSADGKYIATASDDNTARVWEVSNGSLVAKLSHDDGVIAVAFSNDGKYVATASYDNTARVWDASTGKEVAKLNHDHAVWAVAFSSDGKYVATASLDSTARVWKPSTGKEVVKLDHDGWLRDVAFSNDGKYIATASDDDTARVWLATTGKEVVKFNHDGSVSAVAFSADGKYVATASYDNTARVWLATTGKEVAKLNHEGPVSAVAFSPDGKYVATASGDNTARVWDPSTGNELSHDGPVRAVAFSADDKYVATASLDNTARVWETTTGDFLAKLNHDGPVIAVAFSNDGKYLATASSDKTARVWDASTGNFLAKLSHDGPVIAVAFSNDGKYVATASEDNTARVWNPRTGSEVAKLNHGGLTGVAFSSDSKYVATASYDNTARVWDPSTGKEVAKLSHDHQVNAVAFSADGKYLATASFGGIWLWDIATWNKVVKFNQGGYVWTVVFSPDGQYVAAASGAYTVGVWEASTTKEVAKLSHDRGVNSVAFSADGKYVATASSDKTARVWDATTGDQLAQLKHGGQVSDVAFSADGQYVATASSDNTARVHSLNSEGLVNQACSRLSRNLTAEEWEKYMNKELHEYHKTCDKLPVHQSLLAEARKLAEEDEVEEAEKLLGALVKLDDEIDLLPKTEAIERDSRAVVRQFQAKDKVSKGRRLASDGNVDEAIRLFKEAQELQRYIDLNPKEKGEQITPEKVARQLAAKGKVRQGVGKAEEGEIEDAISLFQEAQKLQRDIDLNPKEKGEQIKPEKVARQLAAKGKVRQGVGKAEDGKMEDATRIFQEAQKLQPDIDLNPYEKGEQIKPEKVARRLAAKSNVLKGVRLAAEGMVFEAIALWEKAQELQPDIDLFPYTEEIENDPEAVARQLAKEN